MNGSQRKDELRCQLLDLIAQDRESWLKFQRGGHGSPEERELELRLGPPGEEHWSINGGKEEDPLLSPSSFSISSRAAHSGKPMFQKQQTEHSFLQFSAKSPQNHPVSAKESLRACCTKVASRQNAENKAFSPSSANTAVHSGSQKRCAPAPVVGWPPIRSFRKNLASISSSKPSSESQNVASSKNPVIESCRRGLFVKINMDGVPIGRKVDLNVYESYEKLSSAVDELFRDLLAAQKDSSACGIMNNPEEQAITGLLDGSGEYTLVYEDNEGDRMLVGDVPWHMFVSTVKRLRVLKSSELPILSWGNNRQEKMSLDSALK